MLPDSKNLVLDTKCVFVLFNHGLRTSRKGNLTNATEPKHEKVIMYQIIPFVYFIHVYNRTTLPL